MTIAAAFETPAPIWTRDGDLAGIPAANDNMAVGSIQFGHTGAPAPMRLVPRMTNVIHMPRSPAVAPKQNLPRVIALSGAAGSGKSTVASYLAARGYARTKFAGPLKEMCRAIGMTEAMIEGDQKETPVDWLGGQTPRHVMQTLGTWGRDHVDSDFWISMWKKQALSTGSLIAVDDCRYPNEADAVRKAGGRVIRIIGRGGIPGNHSSEVHDFIADEVICNDGSIGDLHQRVAEVLDAWRL